MTSGTRGRTGADEPAPERLYTNSLSVSFTLSEVELVFGQQFGGDSPACRSWLVTSPVHLVTFGRLIEQAIARYQVRFGQIPVGAAPPDGPRQ